MISSKCCQTRRKKKPASVTLCKYPDNNKSLPFLWYNSAQITFVYNHCLGVFLCENKMSEASAAAANTSIKKKRKSTRLSFQRTDERTPEMIRLQLADAKAKLEIEKPIPIEKIPDLCEKLGLEQGEWLELYQTYPYFVTFALTRCKEQKKCQPCEARCC
jgi:hypothetical protein